jgi:hypothetical protein
MAERQKVENRRRRGNRFIAQKVTEETEKDKFAGVEDCTLCFLRSFL